MLNEETLYARFISGELSSQEIESLKANGDWEKLTAIAKMTSTFELPSLNKEKGFEVLKEKRNRQSTIKSPRRISFRSWSGIAASLLILVSSLFWLNNRSTSIEAEYGKSLAFSFKDDSRALLNAGSVIKYSEKGWDKERRVFLEGEAYFTVTKGERFLVETSQGSVEVLGTEFNVKARSGVFEVECYEGRVQVRQKVENTILNAPKAVYYDGKKSDSQDLNKAKPDWMNGRSVFRNEKLESVLSELERQYNIKVTTTENGRFTGSFVHSDLNLAVQQISKPLGLKGKISNDAQEVSFTK